MVWKDKDGNCICLTIQLHPLAENVWESANGLVWKKRQAEPDKAQQEFLATELARLLLPKPLAPPSNWGVVDGYFVSEKLCVPEFEMFNKKDPRHVARAARYLADLHNVATDMIGTIPTNKFPKTYFGEEMRKRLKQEVGFAKRGFDQNEDEKATVNVLETIVQKVTEWRFDTDPELGHGDFQAKNLFVDCNRAWPIDWTDFGLCDRAYEVAHYLHSVSDDLAEMALNEYSKKTTWTVGERLRGIVADGIIRAGSRARPVAEGHTKDRAMDFAKFKCHVERADRAMNSP